MDAAQRGAVGVEELDAQRAHVEAAAGEGVQVGVEGDIPRSVTAELVAHDHDAEHHDDGGEHPTHARGNGRPELQHGRAP